MKDESKEKKSIRNFVSEEELKFEIYMVKYNNFVKTIKNTPSNEITKKWNYDINKKVSVIEKTRNKDKYANAIAQEAIDKNINYLKNLKPPTSIETIQKDFLTKKNDFIDFLMKEIEKTDSNKDRNELKLKLKRIKNLTLENYTKERFGEILLLIIKNINNMPSFSGYSDNWSQDFYSDSIEKTLLYINNFDENLYSKRTGKHIKSFAYITQICFNAFINVINKRKKEEDFIKEEIVKKSNNYEGVRNLTNNHNRVDRLLETSYERNISEEEFSNINNIIQETIEYVSKLNEHISYNKEIEYEINELENISEEEKSKDYYDYMEELKSKLIKTEKNKKIETLVFKIPKNSDLSNVSYNTRFNVILTSGNIVKEKSKTGFKDSLNGFDFDLNLSKKEKENLQREEEIQSKITEFENEW